MATYTCCACGERFDPEPHNKHHQKYCSKPSCSSRCARSATRKARPSSPPTSRRRSGQPSSTATPWPPRPSSTGCCTTAPKSSSTAKATGPGKGHGSRRQNQTLKGKCPYPMTGAAAMRGDAARADTQNYPARASQRHAWRRRRRQINRSTRCPHSSSLQPKADGRRPLASRVPRPPLQTVKIAPFFAVANSSFSLNAELCHKTGLSLLLLPAEQESLPTSCQKRHILVNAHFRFFTSIFNFLIFKH